MRESEDLLRRIHASGTSYVRGTAALKRLRRQICCRFFHCRYTGKTLLINHLKGRKT